MTAPKVTDKTGAALDALVLELHTLMASDWTMSEPTCQALTDAIKRAKRKARR